MIGNESNMVPEQFTDRSNNFSMNKGNKNNYSYYINLWAKEIQQDNLTNLNKYIDNSFAFLRDLSKYNELRDNSTAEIIELIKNTNKYILDKGINNQVKNQVKFNEMNRGLQSGLFKGGTFNFTNFFGNLNKKTNKTLKKKSKSKSKSKLKSKRKSKRKSKSRRTRK
uniref:Uncharacterized protein n=1 Tax=viral metagenome TaxID=1070528 RepID=A0A6C0KQE9_9ZZZZ